MTYHIHVKSRDAAWDIADGLVPCDYLVACTSAGYPVYETTDGGGAWISDLGNRLEVTHAATGDSHIVWIDRPTVKDYIRDDDY